MPRGADSRWIVDQLLKLGQWEVDDELVGLLIEYGMKYSDFQLTMNRVKTAVTVRKEWEKNANRLAAAADSASGVGHRRTALGLYHRAALAYGRAYKFMDIKGSAEKERLVDRCMHSYQQAMSLTPYPVERIEIETADGLVPGYFHRPHGDGPFPTVLFYPGMNQIKEDFPNLMENVFVERGLAVFSFDPPGHGEALFRGLVLTRENPTQAGRAALDALVLRPEVDSTRLGVFGLSMGSYWSAYHAAVDDRVKACVAGMGCLLEKHTLFFLTQPGFEAHFRFMAGLDPDADLAPWAEELSHRGRAKDIRCPVLIAQGEYDQVSPVEQAYEFRSLLTAPSDLWIYQRALHSLGMAAAEFLPAAVDWLAERLAGIPCAEQLIEFPEG